MEISINQRDSWVLMYEAALVIEGTLECDGGPGSVSLINNAGAFLFDSIVYELNGKEVDSVRSPGILSCLRGYLCYNPEDSNNLGIAGWAYPAKALTTANVSKFVLRVPLWHLFGFFIDYQLAQFGKHTLRLVRARNDNDVMISSPTTAQAINGILKINNICLKAPIVIPNDILKVKLLECIKADKPILMPFRRWEYHELPQLTTNATKEIWGVKTCTSVESPRFVIMAFQTARRDNTLQDPSVFDNINASDIRLVMNGEYYPTERMELNFADDAYTEAHHCYAQFYANFKNDMQSSKQAVLNYEAYKKNAIFVIDCSKRNTSLKLGTVDIKVEIEARTGFKALTKAYCIIVHDSVLEYQPLSEIIRTQT